jgi:NADH:ubiquinone oxidoreductase subunit F (NADH-binding)/(2Fe-2S) ferredoxin/Pyruvate/2-oxoacid:ferredoxin oxidoreductase delta subunit
LGLYNQEVTTLDDSVAKARIMVGMGTCGLAAGARPVFDALVETKNAANAAVEIVPTGCIGMCEQEPIIDVIQPGRDRVTYGPMTPEKAVHVLESLINGTPIPEEWVIGRIMKDAIYPELSSFRKQRRVVLRNCGFINPESIEEYTALEGYAALEKALATMTPEEVIEEVLTSGLRGRGGGGFPTGLKWRFTRQAPGEKKYLVCNADEGDPGAFMDRSILEGDPHALLEGMAIAAYAVGADEGYIYVRAEYPLAIRRLQLAIKQAEERHFLGKGIFGTDFNFSLHIKEGAGAFVCGEETALLASIEGKRGMPRPRPPFPASKGLWGKPTNINNVETYANIPNIIRTSGAYFATIGTEKSKGTKVFALAGKVNNTGLTEVPMGITLREVIFEIGGGVRDGKKFKAVQIGGPSGGCIPEELLDIPVDYDSLTQAGAIMGSGGMVVMDEDTCMVDVARFFMDFIQKESCGKCAPCRIGTKRMLEILTRITHGEGEPEDLDELLELANTVKDLSLCGLGQTSPNPVLSTIRHFRHEYEAHILDHTCPAKVCNALLTYTIDPEKCTGCGLCARNCPANCISGAPKEAHIIDQTRCTKCNTCLSKCPFEAIVKS